MADNKFTNRKRAIARMRAIHPAVRAGARNGLDRGSAFLVEQIRPNVPRGHGELADSLEWHRSPRRDKIVNIITEGTGQEGDPDNRKARAVENGRADMAAQPHFFPTYRANKRKVRNMTMADIRNAIRKVLA